MNTHQIITTIAPSLILLVVYLLVRFFPASIDSIDKTYISKAPQWWGRDKKTWDTANHYLAGKYLLYTIILSGYCTAMLFISWEYGPSLGYILLVVFFLIANYQVRSYMENKIK